MKTTDILHRIRSFAVANDLTVQDVAERAGVSWQAAKAVLDGSGNPRLKTLESLERIIPPSYRAPRRDTRAP